jgi:PRTRC genetic system protein B
MYGKSNYNGYPHRHPFLTVHEVIHEEDGARLSEGQLLTPQMLREVMAGLGRSLPVEILPERVLVRSEDTVVWWRTAQQSRMFFGLQSENAQLAKMNGNTYPHPPLVFKASGKHLWVRALAENERPQAETNLCLAPYWNCYDNGVVCTGSMKVPKDETIAVIDQWEHAFFASEFTHAAGVRKRTAYRGGFLAMWQSLQQKRKFPARYLVRTKKTFLQFVNNDDHTYRNIAQAG